MNKKVRAFTMMELTITMLITAFVIGIAYSAYLIVSKSHVSYMAKQGEMATLIGMDRLLQKDFRLADKIRISEGGISLQDSGRLIVYEFQPGRIIRRSGFIDTFKVNTELLNFQFEKMPVNPNQPDSLIDELSFSVPYQRMDMPFHYLKSYSSSELFVP